VLLLVRIVQRMRGFLTFQRADPYMTPPDRLKVGQMHASRLFRVSTIYSVLASILLLEASGKAYIDGTYVAVALSVYLQFGFVLVGLWLRKFYAEVDFDAYREGPPSGPVALAAANCD
jgi:hypothetical protein